MKKIVVSVFTIFCIQLLTSCTTLPEQGTSEVFQREKEFSRHPNLDSVLVFPATGDIDKEGEVSKVIQKEIIRQLGSPAKTLRTVELIYKDWGISEIFPLSIQPQLLFFYDVLNSKDIEKISNRNIIRFPGLEYQFNKNFDLKLLVRELTLESKNLHPMVASVNELDFETSSELIKAIPNIESNLTRLTFEAQRLIEPKYLVFTRVDGSIDSYEDGKPVSVTSIIVNFETGSIRSVGRTTSLSENFKVPYTDQIRNLTATLLNKMEKSGLNIPDLY
jgi:hypothetical protein